MARRVVTVFGGSGFIGRHLVRRLATTGATVRVPVRDMEAALFLKTMGDVGQVVPMAVDINDKDLIAAAVDGAEVVINLVGIMSEWWKTTFQRIHVDGATTIAKAAVDAGAKRFVQMSAIGADKNSPSAYARTKALGEEAVFDAIPDATVVRPSVVFGPEDNFFNLFAGLARLSPVLPVLGCPTVPKVKMFPEGGLVDVDPYGDGGTRFQPVYVGDVADAIMAVLDDPEAKGRTYELGGPTVYSFKELMDLMLSEIGRRRLLVPLPFFVARIEAWFLEKWPQPILTRDQVTLLEKDNVVSDDALTLSDLGVEATSAESILPTYLRRFRPGRLQHPLRG